MKKTYIVYVEEKTIASYKTEAESEEEAVKKYWDGKLGDDKGDGIEKNVYAEEVEEN